MFPFLHELKKPLKELSTFGIGGPALYFAKAHHVESLQEMLSYSYRIGLKTFILGKGSNCLFDDQGYNGLVIQNCIDYFIYTANGIFKVGAGYSFARLGGQASRMGLSGLEFASGIPASVGGAIFMNAGANSKETKDCLSEVLFVNEKGETEVFLKEDLNFTYRTSSFQNKKGAIAGGTFLLKPLNGVREIQKNILQHRLQSQPYKEMSAGCVFRNPLGESAGKLIDECGLKGLRCGDALISSIHGNFIINSGNARSEDVINLIQQVKEKVYAKKGINLEEEVRIIPYNE
jgi:UDP-N-acetylmuramate dehydrogenase